MRQFVYPTARSMDPIVIVTFPGIAPIGNIDAAVLARHQVHTSKKGIPEEAMVRCTTADITRILSLDTIAVDSQAVQIECV